MGVKRFWHKQMPCQLSRWSDEAKLPDKSCFDVHIFTTCVKNERLIPQSAEVCDNLHKSTKKDAQKEAYRVLVCSFAEGRNFGRLQIARRPTANAIGYVKKNNSTGDLSLLFDLIQSRHEYIIKPTGYNITLQMAVANGLSFNTVRLS